MGAGAMLGKLTPRLVQLTPRGRQRDDGTPVVGRACEDADGEGGCRRRSWHCRMPTRQVAESSANGEAGTAHVRCTKCSVTRALPYGTVAFTCQACGSDVRVSLSTMSAHAKADVRARLLKAEHVVRSALEDQVTSCRQLCDGVKKCLSEEDATWESQPPDSEAARAGTLVRAAVGSHDWAHAEEMLRHWTALGHPLLPEKFQAALISLKQEDELEVLWQRAVSALTAVDSMDLELWCNEASAKSLEVPTEVKDVMQALRGQERAMGAEQEYQANFKARVTEARMREDTPGLKALAMEAKLLGEDSSVVDAVLGPVKSYRRKRSESLDNLTSTSAPRTSSIRYIKEELAKRGISCAGVIEKDELQSLLAQGRYSPGTETSDGNQSDGPGAAASCRVPYAAPSPKANPSNAAGPAGNPKPPVGPRPRTARCNQAPPTSMAPGMPGGSEGTVPARASRATFASAWAQLWSGASSSGESAECVPGGSSCSSKPPAASTKPQSSDDSSCGIATGAQRPMRPSSASAKPYANWSNLPNLEGPIGEASTPRRRPSSASARDSPGPSEPAAARRTPVPSGSASARGTSAHRSSEAGSYRSRSQSYGAQSYVDFSCGGDAAAANSGSSSANSGGTTMPSAHGLPPLNRASRQPQAETSAASVKRTPSVSSASARPPQADARSCDSAMSPRRPPTFRPPSYADALGGEPSAPQRRPSSASRSRASCDDGLGVDPSAPQRQTSSASMRGASVSNPSVSEFIFGIPTPSRPSSASAASQSYAEGPSTPKRPARPSSASRATSSQEAASPRQQPARPSSASRATGSQDAASPRRGMASSPWARSFTTPTEADRRPSKHNSSMPPRPPCQSPRPERTSSRAPPDKGFALPARSATPTREAALTCLGLKGSPTGDEIRRAYKQAALQCHPDRPQNHAIAEEAKENFQQVKDAFDLLQVPERRTTAAAGG